MYKVFKCPNCGSREVVVDYVVENIGDDIIEDYEVTRCYSCDYPYHEGE